MALSLGALCACSEKLPEVTSLKTALTYIRLGKNYTFTYEGLRLVPHQLIFTENSIGTVCDDNDDLNLVYVKDKNGVYSLSSDGENTLGSEYYDFSSDLWSNNFCYTLYGLGEEFISELENETESVTIKDKEYRLAYLQMCGYPAKNYSDLSSLKVKYELMDEKPSLLFTMIYRKTEFSYRVTDFGTSTNYFADDWFASDGHAFVPNETLTKFRNLFKANNYSMMTYAYDEEDGLAGYIGYQLFNPHYYYEQWITSNVGDGYINLDSRAVTEGDNPHPDLKGVYWFTLSGTLPTLNPQCVYEKPNVVEMMHYPSYLRLFSSMEMLKEGWNTALFPNVDVNDEAITYWTDNPTIVQDFNTNFSMDNNIQGNTPVALGIEMLLDDNTDLEENNTQITFFYRFGYGANAYTFPFPFYSFGNSNIPALDAVYEMYND